MFLTLWLRPCLSNREIIDLMWFSWMMFSTSGLSIKTQYNTSKIPVMEIQKTLIPIDNNTIFPFCSFTNKGQWSNIPSNSIEPIEKCQNTHTQKCSSHISTKAVGVLSPEDASKRSSLLTSQSRLSQKRAQFARLPLIKDALGKKEKAMNTVKAPLQNKD